MESKKNPHVSLGQFAATAIAGNDILSSCFYVCGIAILFAGVFAPLVFALVVLILYLYKHVYTEVVEALPLNGGSYNCLLNATSKTLAAVAGVMTVLSYVATSVISAKTAAEYLGTIIAGLPILPLTIGIILFFAVLTIVGVRDSARVAKLIFAVHLFTLVLLVGLGVVTLYTVGWEHLAHNWEVTKELFAQQGVIKMLFFAASASLLGVSGFESSANFVEAQKPGVFRKTLRNMLIGVWVFNPLLALVVLNTLDYSAIVMNKDFVLAQSALQLGGEGLRMVVVIDAFLVLSGAVLSSFIGATGLLYRMTLDRCLPSSLFLPHLRRRNHNMSRIVIGFALLCSSILLITGGKLLSLAGMYTLSFLSAMTIFALGNLILRSTRPDLKRTYTAPLLIVVAAMFSTLIGIVGNLFIEPKNLLYFLAYFIPAVTLVELMIYRDYLLEAVLKHTVRWRFVHKLIKPWFERAVRPRIVLFSHDPEKLYSSLEYIRRNETSRHITVVFSKKCVRGADKLVEKYRRILDCFTEAKVFKNLEMQLEVNDEIAFGPELVKEYATKHHIHRNNMFIGSLHDYHSFTFEELGGVRIIQ